MGKERRPSPPEEPAAPSQHRWQPFWRLRERAERGEDYPTEPWEEDEPLPARSWTGFAFLISIGVWAGLIYALTRWVF